MDKWNPTPFHCRSFLLLAHGARLATLTSCIAVTFWAVASEGTGMRRLGLALLRNHRFGPIWRRSARRQSGGRSALSRSSCSLGRLVRRRQYRRQLGSRTDRLRHYRLSFYDDRCVGFLTGTGVIGGGQIGYNWLVDPNWLIGAEADIQGSGAKASATRFDTVDGEGVTTNYQTKIEWFGTVRGRFGLCLRSARLDLCDRRSCIRQCVDLRNDRSRARIARFIL